jgi:LPXTG-motif cell wall-anchored protein
MAVPASPALADDPTYSFFTSSSTPAVANWADASSNEVGITFKSDVDGSVTALRFYKGDQNTGVHTGSVWTAAGAVLATATFSGETASGWQTVTFDAPVPITAGTTYVASYHTAVGHYSVTINAFQFDGLDRGPLHIPKGGAVYRKGAGFPNVAGDHNYWVDIVFTKKTTSPSASVSASVSPSVSQTSSPPPPAGTPTPTQLGDTGGAALPATGTNVALMVGAGVLLLAVGVLLVLAYRRRTAKFVA